MSDSGDLFLALENLRDVCLVALADTVGGVPDCVYISEGPPSYEACPCLVVWAGSPGGPQVGDTFPLQPALAPAHRASVNAQVNLVPMTVTVLRCSPELDDEGGLPTAEEHEAVARKTTGDVWALWNHLAEAKRQEILFPPKSREFVQEQPIAFNEGGAAGWSLVVRTALDGYRPTL